MKLSNIAMLAALSLAAIASPALAQGSQASTPLPKSVRVIEAATPLRTGPGVNYPIVVTEAEGTVLEVSGRDGDWYRITLSADMVTDPKAPRTAYVLARLVEPATSEVFTQPAPATTGVPSAAPPAPQRQIPQVPPPPRPIAPALRFTGDGSIGLCHISAPIQSANECAVGSGSVRVSNAVDVVVASAIARNSFVGLGVFGDTVFILAGGDAFTATAGVRAGGDLARGRVRIWGEMLAGPVLSFGNPLLDHAWGLNLQPGFGGDLAVNRSGTVAVRPAFSETIDHVYGVWTHHPVFTLSVVFRSVER